MSSDAAISIRHLTKTYRVFDRPLDRIKHMLIPGRPRFHREFTALKDVSLDIGKGETIGIIGRNGSGKSTLLQLICGILKPSAGTVQVNGRISALLELGGGFSPEFTGRENVYFQGALMGLSREAMNQRFDSIAAFAEIGEFMDQPVQTYSSGMFVRLAFAVAAHVDADILVIDEALSVGDVYFVQKCMRYLRRFVEQNGTVLLVSHDIGAVADLCQTVYWLDGGRVAHRGTPKEVTERYLESVYERQQGESSVAAATSPTQAMRGQPRDMRLDFVNTTQYRNDIEIGPFPSTVTGFGKGGATITLADLLDEHGSSLNAVIGGEMVTLLIRGRSSIDIQRPLVGFLVKNRTGQILFGDSTYLSYLDQPPALQAQHEFEARFTFRMPTLPIGDYMVAVAIADGSHQEHVQHHWIHDAVALKSLSSSVATGLVGIPMHSIELTARSSRVLSHE
jgi:lipopolysaccharide transport system ATP-binding protein